MVNTQTAFNNENQTPKIFTRLITLTDDNIQEETWDNVVDHLLQGNTIELGNGYSIGPAASVVSSSNIRFSPVPVPYGEGTVYDKDHLEPPYGAETVISGKAASDLFVAIADLDLGREFEATSRTYLEGIYPSKSPAYDEKNIRFTAGLQVQKDGKPVESIFKGFDI